MDRRNTMIRICYLSALHRYRIHSLIPDNRMYPGQPPILEYLSGHENCTQAELAEFLHISPASVAVSLKRMQKSGLVEKQADKSDLRCNRIFITSSGEEQMQRWRNECDKLDSLLFSGFSDDESAQLDSYIDRLIGNISDGVSDDTIREFFHSRQIKSNKDGEI